MLHWCILKVPHDATIDFTNISPTEVQSVTALLKKRKGEVRPLHPYYLTFLEFALCDVTKVSDSSRRVRNMHHLIIFTLTKHSEFVNLFF